MFALWRCFRGASRIAPTPRPRRPRTLHLEPLEDRRLLATALANVTYHGGPLLQHVGLESVYYGPAWATDANLQQQVQQTDTFLQYFANSPYLDTLAQYGVGHGAVVGHDVGVPSLANAQTIDDSQIHQVLNSAISTGQVAAPTAGSLYVFFTAPGVTVTSNGQSSISNFAGYHSAFLDTAGQPVYYVVVPYPTGGVSSQHLSTFQQETLILSHEVSEAVTDPDTQTGWFDQRRGEIGDIAEGTSGILNGYVVQGVWSQTAGRVVVPSDTTTATLHVSGMPVQAKAGQGFTNIVATITGAPAGSTASNFTASIDWGDGHNSAGTVTADPNGGFDITGSNTYAEAGWYPVTVTVDNTGGQVVGKALTKASVAPAPPTVLARGTPVQATAGQQFSGVVATFTDVNTSATAANFTASIDWGDGTTSDGTITADPKGGFDVSGTHTYAAASSSSTGGTPSALDFFGAPGGPLGDQIFVVRTTVHDTAANASATALSLARVTPPPPDITAKGQNLQATAGQPFSGTVAKFTDVNASAAAGDFTASINWGDGTTSTGTVTADPNGGFDVTGTHTYASGQAGFTFGPGLGLPFGFGGHGYLVTVNITDTTTNDQATAKSLATVAPKPPNLSVTAQNIQATAGQPFSGTVATFTDVDPNATAEGFTATINWGDGTTSDGTITADPKGGFDVGGTHTYAASSNPTPIVLGSHFGLGSDDDVLTATVKSKTTTDQGTGRSVAEVTPAPANLQAFGSQITAVLGQQFSGTVATFTAKGPQATAAGFTATIDWGDGTTSDGTVVADPKGGFDVTGTHTYTDTGDGVTGSGGVESGRRIVAHGSGQESFLVTVTVHQTSDNSSASAVSLASVGATAPNLVTTSQSLTAQAGTKFTGTVATFTDTGSDPVSNYKATIAWGDGSVTTGTVVADPNGGFDVTGSHTYRDGGTYEVLVGVRDTDGDSAVNLSTAVVADSTSPESLGTVASGIVHSGEYCAGVVMQDYQQLLGRSASSGEINFWVYALQHGATDQQVQAGFLGSPEFFSRSGGNALGWLNAMYHAVLGRGLGSADLGFWGQALAVGATQAEVALAIASSPEAQGVTLQNDYQQLLGRTANQAELAFWQQAYQLGATHEQITAAIVQAPEYYQMHHGNGRDWLFGAYQNLLSRQPDQPGLAVWLGVLRPGNQQGETASGGVGEVLGTGPGDPTGGFSFGPGPGI